MMIETDCPYLIPKNLIIKPKNNVNEPKYLPHIAREICELIDIDIDKLKLQAIMLLIFQLKQDLSKLYLEHISSLFSQLLLRNA